MKYLIGIAIMIWSVLSSAKDYPSVLIDKEDGFVDLTFQIAESKPTKKGGNEFVVKGMVSGSKVGFSIELLPEWNPQDIEGIDDAFYWGEAYFKSIGRDSIEFIKSLASLYGANLAKFEIPGSIYAQVVGLACNPGEIANTPCQMKFFFNSEAGEELYSEVFINIDLDAKSLEFNEKDNEYRVPLLRSLLQ